MTGRRHSPDLADLIERDGPANEFWDALHDGRLQFQRCRECGWAWLPPRVQCPRCWKHAWDWEGSSGRGRLISWVVYHRAFHPAFADRVPYNVAIVELIEGPRVVTNIVDDLGDLRIDAAVDLRIEHEGGVALARFVITE